ncbi:AGAP009249-PA-like protein [Anopheles sinensis]|uniref:AGAP009249-PA-like protein n=1 Tax=Anopheles sinensis TaxID=74873 RepID=A0A084WH26_ANOSI|nr:AGAP009249-PA-like protein [Anopheles sinensis]
MNQPATLNVAATQSRTRTFPQLQRKPVSHTIVTIAPVLRDRVASRTIMSYQSRGDYAGGKMWTLKPSFVVVWLPSLILLLGRCAQSDRSVMASMTRGEEHIGTAMMPNVRESLDDCHMRYYNYNSVESSETPVYVRPRLPFREFPHSALLGWSEGPGGPIRWGCLGVLVWENFILTSASCTADGNNMSPNVARFGDLNLYDASDDEYAQQRIIVQIIRHPEHKFSMKYHDIALMRLDRSVIFHDTVAPACLWNGDEIRFKTMEATGWGDTGYAEKRSPILLKVALSLVDPKRCSQHYLGVRGLRDGLQETQMCAGDIKMDTCPGDSGGPLQVKLLHNTRVTPFVVGVTSFGAACGQSVPGVYTRVAPYIPWIQSTLNQHGENVTERMLEPQACALRYVRYREFEPAVILGKRGSYETLEFNNANLLKADTVHHVTIHSNQVSAVESEQCYGVIFDETTVVTLAQCTSINGTSPTHIRYEGDKISAVAEVYKHPKYEQNSSYNNIGVLKLKDAVKFSDTFVPVCLSLEEDSSIQKLTISGKGSLELNDFNPDPTVSSNETIDVHAVAYERNGPNCSLSHDYTSQLEKGLADEHLCFGSEPFLVPGTCNQTLGGPIQSVRYFWGRMLPDVHALNLFGRDCGYGESAVGVKIAYHTEWIESILLPQKDVPDNDEPFIFLNEALEEGDRCVAGRGSDGTCVDASYCPKVLYEWEVGGLVQFCQTGSLVCCPNGFVRNDTNAEWREIDECVNKYNTSKVSFSRKQHLVSMIFNTEVGVKSCVGTIVTSRTIVVAANCVNGMKIPANISIEASSGSGFIPIAVETVIIHHEFNNSTKQHNIALIKMKDRLDEKLGKGPACLWTNSTHTPFYLTQTLLDTSVSNHTEAFPRYSTDCEHTFGRVLQSNELCVDMELRNGKLVVDEDMPALWSNKVGEESFIPFLVGIASHKSVDDSSVFLHTRISSYANCHIRFHKYAWLAKLYTAAAKGRLAFLREFAHMAAIGWSQRNGTINWNCGGSLIWENVILTAAHCAVDLYNKPPTDVRFGDLDLYNDTDDSFAQQYNIVEIIRHPEHRFSAKYHDIALIKLEKNVILNDTVAPACLWDEEEIRFNSFESAGWGATGVGQSQTPILLKVTLQPIEKSKCDQTYRVGDRGLKQGLQDYQLCAGDAQMDTCPGDSGGPLQVKLLHNAKMTPFVVAVTSFGSFCGQSAPGVYTKVAPYIPWIRSVLEKHGEDAPEWKFRPYACAVRYVKLREFEPDIVASKSNTTESLDFRGVHIDMEDIPSTVAIRWDDENSTLDNCYGVLIDEDTVITLAQCASLNGKPPNHVEVLDILKRDIERVQVHPQYAGGSVYNNIAVIRLKEPFIFDELFQPSCPWYFANIPNDQFEVTGRGRTDLNQIPLDDSIVIGIDSKLTNLLSRTSQRTADNCTLPKEYKLLLTNGLADEHLCFGNDLFLVPEACEQLLGGAVHRKVFRLSKYFNHVYALNLLGRDCGYGQAALGVKLGSHTEWLSKILLTHRRQHIGAVQFFNTDLELHDHCKLPDGELGMCTDARRCPKVQYDFSIQRQVMLCANGTIVCCPFHHVLNATEGAGSEFDECPSRYKSVHKEGIFNPYGELDYDEQFPQVMIAWKTQNGSFDFCMGTLITQSAALSTANYLSRIDSDRVVVKLGWEKTAPTLWVSKITFHPRFEASTLRNDIAIVRIAGTVDPKSGKIPACLWQNQTHTPFHLRQFVLTDLQYLNSYPKYNKDCEVFGHYGNRSLEATQLCADLEVTGYPIKSGEPSFWQQRLDDSGTVVHFLVGIVSYVYPAMTVQTRVESYVDWIKSQM